MADLSEFSTKERAFLASIPYRVGMWISNCDDNEGSKVDERNEAKALEVLITDIAGRGSKIPFAAAVMNDALQNKKAWAGWDQISGEEQVLGDVQKAFALCQAKTKKKELNQYKQTLWKVAVVVAQAYGEQIDPDNEMHVDKFFQWVGSLAGGPKLGKNPENISKEEKIALNKLRSILKS